MLTPAQCRAGRALLNWSREELAERSKVSHRSIVDFEREARSPREVTMDALQAAMQREGVVFLAAGERWDGGPGVRLAGGKPEIDNGYIDTDDWR